MPSIPHPSQMIQEDVRSKLSGEMETIKISLFCGGRGSSTIIQNLLDSASVDLSLVINAYDDGLSTGDLRDFIPGILGISDFRKNLSYIAGEHQANAVQRIMELRLPKDVTNLQIEALSAFANGHAAIQDLMPILAESLSLISEEKNVFIRGYLRKFFDYARIQPTSFKYADCALGNLIFAGAYLECGRFNVAVEELGRRFNARARLINLCSGEPRTLVALKEDGTLLCREAEIVSVQNSSPIHSFFFLDQPLNEGDVKAIENLSIEDKQAELSRRERLPISSEEAIATLEQADVIIYGPGTQYSSLLPSYRIKGVADALHRSMASIRVFIVNLKTDHDIPYADARQLIDKALICMGDPNNLQHSITHILYSRNSQTVQNGIKLPHDIRDAGMFYKGAVVIEDDYESLTVSVVHNGEKIVAHILNLFSDIRAQV